MTPGRERHYEDFQKPKAIEQGGILRLSGAFLLDHGDELLNLIKHEGRLAEQKNPQHKINKVEKVDGSILVEISDHNLTMHIGKALTHAYKGEHKYKFRDGEKYIEVDWKRDA